MSGLSLGMHDIDNDMKSVALTVLNWSDWPVRCAQTHTQTHRHTSNEHIISAIHSVNLAEVIISAVYIMHNLAARNGIARCLRGAGRQRRTVLPVSMPSSRNRVYTKAANTGHNNSNNDSLLLSVTTDDFANINCFWCVPILKITGRRYVFMSIFIRLKGQIQTERQICTSEIKI